MTKKIVLFISPLILLMEIKLISWTTELLRQPSDESVASGMLLLCVAIIGNFYLVQFVQNQFKQTIK